MDSSQPNAGSSGGRDFSLEMGEESRKGNLDGSSEATTIVGSKMATADAASSSIDLLWYFLSVATFKSKHYYLFLVYFTLYIVLA